MPLMEPALRCCASRACAARACGVSRHIARATGTRHATCHALGRTFGSVIVYNRSGDFATVRPGQTSTALTGHSSLCQRRRGAAAEALSYTSALASTYGCSGAAGRDRCCAERAAEEDEQAVGRDHQAVVPPLPLPLNRTEPARAALWASQSCSLSECCCGLGCPSRAVDSH